MFLLHHLASLSITHLEDAGNEGQQAAAFGCESHTKAKQHGDADDKPVLALFDGEQLVVNVGETAFQPVPSLGAFLFVRFEQCSGSVVVHR